MLLFILSFSYFWTFSGDSLYKGRVDGTIIARDSVYLGNKLSKLTSDSDGFISDIAEKDGELYYGISDLGLLIRMNSNGSLDTIINAEGGLISLGVWGDFIVAGLSPEGKLLFIKGDGIVDSLSIDASNIYSIFEWKDKLLIGTGPDGEIYEVTKKKIKEFYTVEAHSVTEMVPYSDRLFIGTSTPGLIYEFLSPGNGRIYYDTGFDEVNGLGFCGDTLSVSGIAVDNGTPAGKIKFLCKNKEFIVYEGTSILSGVEVGNRFYAGESEDGQVGEFHRSEFRIIADLEESKITVLKNIHGELYIGTGYPGNIYRMSEEKRKEGTYISSVIDGGIGVVWGNLFYTGKGDISFFERSGKKKEVDSSWTHWSPIKINIEAEGPFLQWKAILRGEGSYLKDVRISYRERNSSPEILQFAVLPSGIGCSGGNKGPQHREFISQEDVMKLRKMGFYVPEQAYHIPDEIRCIYWKTIDPDGDQLVFDLYLKREGEEFTRLAKRVEEDAYFLDTAPYPDGTYIVKLVAKDLPAQSSPLTHERTARFIIDHLPPDVNEIKKQVVGDSIAVSGVVVDKLSSIVGVFYNTATMGGMTKVGWRSAIPADGLFDEKQELFSFKVEKTLKYIAIRVFDRNNNDRVIRLEL
ncbi:hypothetical protein KAX29_01505 [candidate division WOR-3 bacterium]|nr:hypothetical protein [candidate division WOR-3 bacterium]